MATQRARSRNNVRAGAFVLVCLTLFIACVVTLGDFLTMFERTRMYVLDFELAIGAPGLEPGSPVLIGGQDVGRVVRVQRMMDRGDAGVIEVTIAIPPDIQLYEDAAAQLERPLLGSGAWINFPYVGSAQLDSFENDDPLLQTDLDEHLNATIAPPAILAQAGYGPQQRTQVQDIITNAQDIADRLQQITTHIDGEIEPQITAIKSLIEDVEDMSAQTKEHWPEWLDAVNALITRLDEISQQLESGAGDARTLLADAQTEFDDAALKVQRSLDNIEDVTEIAKNETMVLINDTIAKAQDGLDSYREFGEELADIGAEQSPNIRRLLANSRLASEQLKLTMNEVRRAPWRLLYRPNERELESELLYDAARSYAAAVSDLRATTESLRATMLRENVQLPEDRELYDRLITQMEEAFVTYQDAEQSFLTLLAE
ncbi:MAG: hypothetical protein KAS72_09105 [Phycisphaerales bacterium]|nr:hypothetical protein [Phycisphaerales bacterium]